MRPEFRVYPFEPEHVLAIPDIEDINMGLIKSRAYLDAIQKCGPGFTLFNGNVVVGSVVFLNLWSGLAEVVMFISRSEIEKNPLTSFKICKENIDRLQKENKWRRIQANIVKTSKRNIRWAKHLGFEVEHVRESFGPGGEDCVEMVRIRKDANAKFTT